MNRTVDALQRAYIWEKPNAGNMHVPAMEKRKNELLRVDIGSNPALQKEWVALCESLDAAHGGTKNTAFRASKLPSGYRKVMINRAGGKSLGIQIVTSSASEVPQITWVSPTGPSHAAGVVVGDGVHAINGVDCSSKSNPEMIQMIQASGATVTLLLGDPKLPPISPDHLPTDREEATPEAKNTRNPPSRTDKLSSLLKRIPRTEAAPLVEPGAGSASAAVGATKTPGKSRAKSRDSTEKAKKKGAIATAPTPPSSISTKSATQNKKKTSSKNTATSAVVTPSKKGWNVGASKSKTPASNLFSYVSPLNRGVKYKSRAEEEEHVPFWERDAAPAPSKSLSEARLKVKESREQLTAKVEKQKQKTKDEDSNPKTQSSAKEFIRQQRAARRKQRLLKANTPAAHVTDLEEVAQEHDEHTLLLCGPPLGEADIINIPRTPSPSREPCTARSRLVGPGSVKIAPPMVPALAKQPADTAGGRASAPLPNNDANDSDGLTWGYVEKMAGTLDAQLQSARSDCNAASRERDELLQKLLSMTNSYDQLLQSKESEGHKWIQTNEKLKEDILRTKRAHVAALEVADTSYKTRLATTLADAERRLERTHSYKATGREAELQKEVASLSTMIAALEDTLKAKDELLELKERSHAAELLDLDNQHQDEIASREDDVRSHLQLEITSLADQVSSLEHNHEAEKQTIIAEKQAEMDAALASCQEAMLSMDNGGTAGHGPAVESLLSQMRAALAGKEEEKAAALRRKDSEIAKALQKHEATVELALAKKDREINTAMELAQAEVDRMLIQKQEEVERLLDERDLVIRSLQIQVHQGRFTVGGDQHSSVDVGQSLSGNSGHFEEMVQLKTEENVALDKVLQRTTQTVERLERQIEDDFIIQAEKEAAHQIMIAAMQEALTEAMSAKGDLLCLDQCASALVADKIAQSAPQLKESAEDTLSRLEEALASTDPSVNREVIRLKLEIERLRKEGVSEETIAKLTGFTESALQSQAASLETATQAQPMPECETALRATAAAAASATEIQKIKAEGSAALKEEKMSTLVVSRRVGSLESEVTLLRRKAEEHYVERRRLLNELQELKGNVRVHCRVRPLLSSESLVSDTSHIILPADRHTGKLVVVDRTKQDLKGDQKETAHDFEYNSLFGPESSQAEVFEDVKQLVQCAVLGYNVCIFAYGQTGSGKTYTMTGEDGSETRGLIPRAVNFLFEEMASLEARGWEFSARASFLEIYNEQIRDLLDDSGEQKQHTVKMAKDGMQFISNLQELTVESSEDLAELMQVALTNRAVATSEMNERSSRSHSVCRITLVGTRGSTQIQSTINMVDLAGSERLSSPSKAEIDLAPLDERAALHENASKRQAETLAINKSLSALASVIQAVRVKSNHVPYRDSKLTYVLQDALGKDSKCLMMVNVSPRTDCLNETLCSLRFASKVNDTTRGPAKRNITTDKQKRSLPSVCKPE